MENQYIQELLRSAEAGMVRAIAATVRAVGQVYGEHPDKLFSGVEVATNLHTIATAIEDAQAAKDEAQR